MCGNRSMEQKSTLLTSLPTIQNILRYFDTRACQVFPVIPSFVLLKNPSFPRIIFIYLQLQLSCGAGNNSSL